MNRGRKEEAPSTKFARGTVQPVRDGGKTEIIVRGDPPIMPDYLTAEAQDVWQEQIGRVMSVGITDTGSSLFARGTARSTPSFERRSTILTATRRRPRISKPSLRWPNCWASQAGKAGSAR